MGPDQHKSEVKSGQSAPRWQGEIEFSETFVGVKYADSGFDIHIFLWIMVEESGSCSLRERRCHYSYALC